jgi:drug/metabolite transporter (DMT)-like permease
MKRAHLVWLAVVLPTWLAFMMCAHWEPVLRDGWGHVQWHRTSATTLSTVWQFAHDSYVHNNPRIGQVLTLLVYTPGPWHEIVTPLVELALFYLLALHALGRKPSFARVDDALMFATIIGMVGLTAPLVGQMLFYRPFTGNYLFSFVIALIFFAPYRLHAAAPTERRWWWIVIMLVLGYATGLGNEHTGPTFVVVTIFAILAFWRRGERPRAWMIAGLIGVLAGGLALYFAPAQSIRYNALATSTSLLGRISARTFGANIRIVGGAYAGVWKLAPWLAFIAIGWRVTKPTRSHVVSAFVAIGASLLIAVTLLVSPKQGGRLDFASICLACMAVASLIVPFVQARWAQGVAWVAAAVAIAYLLYNCLVTYHEVGAEFRTRFDAIESAPPHGVVMVTPYTLPRSRWFLGEDFAADGLRFGIAWNRQLQGVVLTAPAEANEDPGGL